nr:MAG TPA: hypothetical protein [Caudoviricetes sp.]
MSSRHNASSVQCNAVAMRSRLPMVTFSILI